VPSLAVFEIMSVFSLLELAANSLCLLILWRHQNEDVNMTLIWECSVDLSMVVVSFVVINQFVVWFLRVD
jgi:hypothetical protein